MTFNMTLNVIAVIAIVMVCENGTSAVEQQGWNHKFMETNYIPVQEIQLWTKISQIVCKAPFTNNKIVADLSKYPDTANDKILYQQLGELLESIIS